MPKQDFYPPKLYSHLTLMYHSPDFCFNPFFLDFSLYLYPFLSRVVMMKESLVCQWVPPLTGHDGSYSLCYCSPVSNLVSKRGDPPSVVKVTL